ncbi:MAG: CoA-binding protein [Candidatus Omnitrophica bacterium]|nr:CoA-binding protein [Candidatus Omnitrophota bacterium]
MEKLISDFLAQKTFAVAGSFRDDSKYAYRILKALKHKGYDVYPVHPVIKEVEGLCCYSSVKDIPFTIDVVNLVTPPAVTESILVECKDKGIRKIWLQPGAENEKAIQYCKDNGMDVVYQVCVMMKTA